MSIPTDMLAQAEAVGQQQQMMLDQTMIVPEGKFSKGALNRLVKQLNVVLEMFDQSYPEFNEDITVFPPEFVTSLEMVMTAANDAGVDFDLDFEEIKDDRDLAMVAGKLSKLAKDKTFKRFLESNSLRPEEAEEETVVEEETVEMPSDMDEMFARRM